MTSKILVSAFPSRFLILSLIMLGLFQSAHLCKAETPDQALARERYLEYAEQLRKTILLDTCPYQVATVIKCVGDKPAVLAQFVKTAIGFEAYQGSLRGAEGALAAGQANDWDKAILLSELIRALQFKTSFVLVPRTEQEIEHVLSEIATKRANWCSLADDGVATSVAGMGKPTIVSDAKSMLSGFPEENRLRYQRQNLLSLKGLLSESALAGEREAPRLETALKHASQTVTFDFNRFETLRRMSLNHRVLVEYEEAGVKHLLDAGPDLAPVSMERQAKVARTDAPPADQQGELRMRVSLTQAGEGAATQPVFLFEDRMPLTEPLRHAPRLEIVPVETPHNGSPNEWSPENWYDFLAGFKKFQVVLRKGGETLGSKVFDLDGNLADVTSDGNVADASSIGEGVGGMFGGAFGGDDEEPATETHPKTTLETVVLEIEVCLPGQPLIRQRRLLYGNLRPETTPICTVDFLFGGGPISPTCTAWRTLDSVTANARLLMNAMEAASSGGPGNPESVERMPTMLFDWQMGRLALAARLVKANPALRGTGGEFCILLTNSLERSESEKRVRMRVALDVIFDSLKLVPLVAADAGLAFRKNLQMGVSATALESGILRRYLPSPMANGTIPAWVSALAKGLKPRTVNHGSVDQIEAEPLAAWALRQMEPVSTLVFPGESKPGAWWSIEPSSGCALGRGGCGEGLAAVEYVQLIKMNLSNLKCHLAFMQSFFSGGGEKAATDWAMCITGTDNPGSYVGWGGSTMETVFKVHSGGTIAQVGDALSGLYDLVEMAKGASK